MVRHPHPLHAGAARMAQTRRTGVCLLLAVASVLLAAALTGMVFTLGRL